MLMHVLFYVTDFQESPWTLWTERFVVEAFQMNSLWVWCSLFSCHLQSQIIHHKLLLRFRDFTTTCVAFFSSRTVLIWSVVVLRCVVSAALWLTNHTNSAAAMLPLLQSSSSPAPARPDLVKRSVCVCAGCLEMWGLIVHLLTSLFHLVSGFTQKTSVEPRQSLAALPSLTPPLTRACVSAASDVEGFVSEIKLAGGSKQQNLTWLSIIWSTWCRVNSRWLPVELRRF